MSAKIASDLTVTQLDRKAEPDEVITETDVKEPKKLSQYLLRIFKEITLLKRRFAPRHIDFEQQVSTGSSGSPQTITLQHNFNAEVRWWVVDVQSAGTVVVPLINRINVDDLNFLFLNVYYQATLTIRVEEAGA